MKRNVKQFAAFIMAICMLATCVFAQVPGSIDITATAKEQSSGAYNVTYTASLTMPEELAMAAAVTFPDARLFDMTFVCTLEDALVKQLNTVSEDDFTFNGGDIFVFESIASTANGLEIRYVLNEDIKTAWQNLGAEEIKKSLQTKMTMSASETGVAKEQIDTALAESNPVAISAKVTIDGEFGSFGYESGFVAAEGTAELTITPYKASTGGLQGTTGEAPEKHGVTVGDEADDKGIVSVDRAEAPAGTTVTITAKPDTGYKVESITVTTEDGKAVKVNKTGDETFTFTMPQGAVSIAYEFAPAIVAPEESGISEYLETESHIAYMHGYPEGDFRPEGNITRAEVCQMFYNLMLDKSEGEVVEFDDVDQNQWYAKALNKLASMGIINGVGNNKFEPSRAITRAEFATVVARFAKEERRGFDFADVSDNHWAYECISTAAGYGWINGVGNNKFEPNRAITRAEAATLVNRMLGRIADKAAIDAGAAIDWPDVADSFWGRYEVAEATTDHEHSYNEDRTVENWVY